MNETNSLLYSGALAFDPVRYGVARGLSDLFPPVDHPEGIRLDEAAAEDADPADETTRLMSPIA